MRLLGSVKIKTLALAGNLLLAVIGIGGAVAAYTGATSSVGQLNTIAGNSIPALSQLSTLSTRVMEARLATAKHILAETPEETKVQDGQLAEKEAEVEKLVQAYAPLVSNAEEQTIYERVTSNWAAWKVAADEIRQRSLAMDKTGARVTYSQDLNPRGAALAEAMQSIRSYNEKLGADAGAAGMAGAGRQKDIALVVIIGAALLTMLVVAFTFLRITRPLAALTTAIEDMARGNLDRDMPYLDSQDEIGGIGRGLEAVKTAIARRTRDEGEARLAVQEQMVGGLATGLQALRDGQLDCRIEAAFPAEYETLRHDFNETVTVLANVISEVVQGAQNVRTGAGEIASAASDLSRRTESQAAALEESAAAVRQLTQSVRDTATTAEKASVVAREARHGAGSGGEMMIRAVTAIEEIARSSERMGAIIAVIEGIAFQTNLLALNAGVEAARAGESGKGFAVVANEVRALAQRATAAAAEITDIIRSSATEVAGGVDLIGQTQRALETILSQTANLSDLIGTIAVATGEQSNAIVQVNTVVSDMDRITQQNAALVEESTAASQHLSGAATNLLQQVERFALSRNAGRGHSGYTALAA